MKKKNSSKNYNQYKGATPDTGGGQESGVKKKRFIVPGPLAKPNK